MKAKLDATIDHHGADHSCQLVGRHQAGTCVTGLMTFVTGNHNDYDDDL